MVRKFTRESFKVRDSSGYRANFLQRNESEHFGVQVCWKHWSRLNRPKSGRVHNHRYVIFRQFKICAQYVSNMKHLNKKTKSSLCQNGNARVALFVFPQRLLTIWLARRTQTLKRAQRTHNLYTRPRARGPLDARCRRRLVISFPHPTRSSSRSIIS